METQRWVALVAWHWQLTACSLFEAAIGLVATSWVSFHGVGSKPALLLSVDILLPKAGVGGLMHG